MSEWLNDAFSGGVSFARVHPAGVALMVLAIGLLAAAKVISARCPEDRRTSVCNLVKISGLLICALGAAISFL